MIYVWIVIIGFILYSWIPNEEDKKRNKENMIKFREEERERKEFAEKCRLKNEESLKLHEKNIEEKNRKFNYINSEINKHKYSNGYDLSEFIGPYEKLCNDKNFIRDLSEIEFYYVPDDRIHYSFTFNDELFVIDDIGDISNLRREVEREYKNNESYLYRSIKSELE